MPVGSEDETVVVLSVPVGSSSAPDRCKQDDVVDQSDPGVDLEDDDLFLSAPDRCEQADARRESNHDRVLEANDRALSAKVVSQSAHAVIQSAKVVVLVDADRRETNQDRY